jgi:hypothetical protein
MPAQWVLPGMLIGIPPNPALPSLSGWKTPCALLDQVS